MSTPATNPFQIPTLWTSPTILSGIMLPEDMIVQRGDITLITKQRKEIEHLRKMTYGLNLVKCIKCSKRFDADYHHEQKSEREWQCPYCLISELRIELAEKKIKDAQLSVQLDEAIRMMQENTEIMKKLGINRT